MLAAAALSIVLAAPVPTDSAWPAPGDHVWSCSTGVGFSHVIAHSLADRRFVLGRAGWSYQLEPRVALGVEAIPLYVLGGGGEGTTTGLGFTLGGRMVLHKGRSCRPGLDVGAGMVRFTDPVPAAAVRANFILELGLYVERALRPGASLVGGYRLHHVSNADRADVNPGINASHPYVELRLWRSARRGHTTEP